jgi:hypothetical protein
MRYLYRNLGNDALRLATYCRTAIPVFLRQQLLASSKRSVRFWVAGRNSLGASSISQDGDGLPVKESISAHEILKKLEEAEAKDLRVCAVSNREVSDPLDLSSRKVKVAMDIQNCDFQREVDLSYCDFEQTVDFSDCTFHSDFIAGDKDKSYTVFRKDLLCNRAVFNGAARFRGVRCEGKALFRDTWFQREGEEADFGSASFKEALDNTAE